MRTNNYFNEKIKTSDKPERKEINDGEAKIEDRSSCYSTSPLFNLGAVINDQSSQPN